VELQKTYSLIQLELNAYGKSIAVGKFLFFMQMQRSMVQKKMVVRYKTLNAKFDLNPVPITTSV